MSKQVYVVTETFSGIVMGVYSNYENAINAVLARANGYTVYDITVELADTLYDFFDLNDHVIRFCITPIEVDADSYSDKEENEE